jgi:hypothetical protein
MDKVPSHVRQRAAAELRRYAALLGSLLISCRATVNRTHAAITVLAAAGMFSVCQALAQQSKISPEVLVYATYYEADGMRFDSLEELRKYLSIAPNDFYSFFIRDCAAKGREQELKDVIFGVLFERRARRGEKTPVNLGFGSIPCP